MLPELVGITAIQLLGHIVEGVHLASVRVVHDRQAADVPIRRLLARVSCGTPPHAILLLCLLLAHPHRRSTVLLRLCGARSRHGFHLLGASRVARQPIVRHAGDGGHREVPVHRAAVGVPRLAGRWHQTELQVLLLQLCKCLSHPSAARPAATAHWAHQRLSALADLVLSLQLEGRGVVRVDLPGNGAAHHLRILPLANSRILQENHRSRNEASQSTISPKSQVDTATVSFARRIPQADLTLGHLATARLRVEGDRIVCGVYDSSDVEEGVDAELLDVAKRLEVVRHT
mmetsp:Transcript_82648/g.210241  ORF Transcript_82648/g.210241 Transcript_82648/m.210241 type:complete len:288 (-) Transcript_82648:562-1425(-)